MNANNPSPHLDPAAFNDRVTAAVHSHRLKLRLLTSVAFLFGFLAVAAGVFIVWFYLFMYLPKQRQMIQEAEAAVQQARTASSPTSVEEDVKRIDKFLGVQIVLTYVISAGVTLVGVSVGVLALGTLTLLTVVILNRRVTLNQINVSLAQISNQLRELQITRSTGSSLAS